MNSQLPAQATMEIIRTRREYASALSQANLRVTAVCSVSERSRQTAAHATIDISTALALLSVAEANTRQAAILGASNALTPVQETTLNAYLATAETVIESAELLLFQAQTHVSLAATGRDDITVPSLPEKVAATAAPEQS